MTRSAAKVAPAGAFAAAVLAAGALVGRSA